MERDRGLRLDKSPPAVLVRARGEVADRPVMSSCYHNRQGHASEAFVAEQAQWLHVFIDVAPDVSDESASFWSAVLGWPVGEQWPGHPEFRSFTPQPATPTSINRWETMALGSISILRFPIVASPIRSFGWERSSPATATGGAR
jgi:hypothetical protein